MAEANYDDYLLIKNTEFEDICKNCGECCGSLDDPCSFLIKKPDGTYSCKDYENRLGKHKTVSGFAFKCVSIREHIKNGTLCANCAYKGTV